MPPKKAARKAKGAWGWTHPDIEKALGREVVPKWSSGPVPPGVDVEQVRTYTSGPDGSSGQWVIFMISIVNYLKALGGEEARHLSCGGAVLGVIDGHDRPWTRSRSGPPRLPLDYMH